MAKAKPPAALSPAYDPVDTGFLEARSKLVDLAAFFDRVERRGRTADYRVQALFSALKKIAQPEARAERTASVLRALSDPSVAPVAKAGSPASGAFNKKGVK
jgi:hypothetical protein